MDSILITTAATLTAGLGVGMAYFAMQRTLKAIAVAARRSRNR